MANHQWPILEFSSATYTGGNMKRRVYLFKTAMIIAAALSTGVLLTPQAWAQG
jgi:hypothetical protein